MALDITKLVPVGHGAGHTLWLYKTADLATTVDGADYFLGAINMLKLHDIIIGVCDTGGTPQAYIFHVNANNGTTIDTTNGLAVGTTDSD